MSEDEPYYLLDVIEFEEETNPDMLLHYNNMITAIHKKLWYDLDTMELVSQDEFQAKRRMGQVFQYSSSPMHPVFGQVGLYREELGPAILDFARDLRSVARNVMETLDKFEYDHDLEAYLLELLPQLSTPFITSLCNVNSRLQRRICSGKTLWTKLWRMSYPDMRVPNVHDLRRLWLKLREQNQPTVHLINVASGMKLSMLRGLLIREANTFQLIHGDEIHARYDSSQRWVVKQTYNGVDVVNKADMSADDLFIITEAKGASYFF